MNGLLSYALEQPAMLVVPAAGLVLSLWLARVKSRYVREGILLSRDGILFRLTWPITRRLLVAALAKRENEPLSSAVPETAMDIQLLTLALDGLIARFAALENSYPSTDELVAESQQAIASWRLLRDRMGRLKGGPSHFESQADKLDSLTHFYVPGKTRGISVLEWFDTYLSGLRALRGLLVDGAMPFQASTDGSKRSKAG